MKNNYTALGMDYPPIFTAATRSTKPSTICIKDSLTVSYLESCSMINKPVLLADFVNACFLIEIITD